MRLLRWLAVVALRSCGARLVLARRRAVAW